MKGTPAIYLGRIVEKKNFRAFIYGANGEKRLVESWEEFEANMQSGIWFASIEDAEASVSLQGEEVSEDSIPPKPKAKAKGKSKPKPVKVEEIEEEASEIAPDELDDMVYEVKDGE